jgi:hypothetical protein
MGFVEDFKMARENLAKSLAGKSQSEKDKILVEVDNIIATYKRKTGAENFDHLPLQILDSQRPYVDNRALVVIPRTGDNLEGLKAYCFGKREYDKTSIEIPVIYKSDSNNLNWAIPIRYAPGSFDVPFPITGNVNAQLSGTVITSNNQAHETYEFSGRGDLYPVYCFKYNGNYTAEVLLDVMAGDPSRFSRLSILKIIISTDSNLDISFDDDNSNTVIPDQYLGVRNNIEIAGPNPIVALCRNDNNAHLQLRFTAISAGNYSIMIYCYGE